MSRPNIRVHFTDDNTEVWGGCLLPEVTQAGSSIPEPLDHGLLPLDHFTLKGDRLWAGNLAWLIHRLIPQHGTAWPGYQHVVKDNIQFQISGCI